MPNQEENIFKTKLRIKERYYYATEIIPLPQSNWFSCDKCRDSRLNNIAIFCDDCQVGLVKVLKIRRKYLLPPTECEKRSL